MQLLSLLFNLWKERFCVHALLISDEKSLDGNRVLWWGKSRKNYVGQPQGKKIASKQPMCALLASARPCLCLPFHGTPGVLASTWCSQNALWCHLFKHCEPPANRDKPLFIKPLILAARMTTWLVLKGALKSFIEVGEDDLYSWRKALWTRVMEGVHRGDVMDGVLQGLMGQTGCTLANDGNGKREP